MDLVRECTALQIEMLGAAARVWSEIVERVANYNRELTNEVLAFSSGHRDASAVLDRLVDVGKRSVRTLADLPNDIGQTFATNVRKRAGRTVD